MQAMQKLCFRTLSSAIVLTAALVSANGAHAQEAAGDPPTGTAKIDEIVVTAQKRSENVQDVPIAIAAFSGEALQEKGIGEISQLANQTPSVQLSNSSQIVSSPSSLSGFIRGIGQDDFSTQFEPGVGTYVDGVYLARTVGANANLLDVERVEILKGPQGTLFGRNTIGGAISVVTRAPSDEFGVRLQGTIGRFNRVDVGGIVDIPIAPGVLTSSIAVNYSSRDGYQKRIPFPGADNFYQEPITAFSSTGAILGTGARDRLGGGNELNGRIKLLWNASDAVRVTLAADYTRANQGASATTLIRTSQGGAGGPTLTGIYNACINTPAAVLAVTPLAAICGPRVGPGTALGGVNADADTTNDRLTVDDRFVTGDIDTTYGAGNNFSRLRNFGVTGTIDIDLTDDIALKSITAYRKQKWNIGLDIDGTPVQIFEPNVRQDQHQFSQELQLSGKAIDNRLNWLLGVYYFDEHSDEQQNPNFAAGLFTILNPASFDTKSYAAFGHLNFAVTDQLGITLGARYTEETKHLDPSQLDINLFLQKAAGVPAFLYPDPTDLRQLLPTARQRLKFNNFSPRVGLEFKPTDDVMIYGSFSRGYKSGGWTTRVTAPVMAVPTFNPEQAETFEAGIKSELFDRRLQLNIAAFTTKYKAIQLLIQRGISPTFENAGTARIKGIEVEGQAVLSDIFRVNASAGYIDAHFTAISDPTAVITLDSDLPRVPAWTVHVGPEARFDLGSGTLKLRADYSYRSRSANDAENTPELYSRAVNLVDASITYEAPDESWSITAGGRNIFNERYVVNGTNQLPAVGILTANYNRPGEWYVSTRIKF